MKILLIDNGTTILPQLKKLLSGNTIEVRNLFSQYPDPEKFNLIILSGGSKYEVVPDAKLFCREMNLVKTTPTPIIGICEGCELIAYTYGSKLKSFKPKAHGVRKIEILGTLFNPPIVVEVYEAHHWAIKKLGPDLIGLAKSRHGYEIIKHKTKLIYGLQFHPEMLVNQTQGDEIYKHILQIIRG